MKLGKYKGIKVKEPAVEVTPEEIERVFERKQQKNRILYSADDRAAKMGDEVMLDFFTEIDGVKSQEAGAENYRVILGSGKLIPGFEKNLAGHRIGETVDLAVRFTDEYKREEMRGKTVTYHLTIKAIWNVLTEPLDDDFAKDYSEYETLDEWKDAVWDELTEIREESAYEKMRHEVLAQIIANSEITVDPSYLEETMALYEDEEEESPAHANMSPEERLEAKRAEALRDIKEQRVLLAVAKKEKLEVSEEEIQEELEAEAEENDMEVSEFVDWVGEEQLEYLEQYILTGKAMDLILEAAIFE